MTRPTSLLVTAILAVVLCSSARAEEQLVFKLKNGRKIVGELVEEKPDAYVVSTAHGKTTISKSQVENVAPVAKPGKQFLDPDAPPPAKDDTTRPPPTKPDRPDTPPPVKPAKAAPKGAPVSNPAAIEKARVTLADANKAISNAHEGDREKVRERRVAELLKSVPIDDLVGLIAKFFGVTAATAEETLAYELVIKSAAAARPVVARAVAAWDTDSGRPVLVLKAIEELKDDEKGVLEAALASKVESLLSIGTGPDAISSALSKLGTRRSLPRLYDFILSADPEVAAAADLAKIAKEILARETDVDAVLAPLVAKIDPRARTGPALYRLRHALELVALSKGPRSVEQLLDAVEGTLRLALSESTTNDEARKCHASLVQAAGAIGTDKMRSFLFHVLDGDKPEVRADTIKAIGKLSAPEAKPQAARDLVERLVSDKSWSEDDKKASFATLNALTGASVAATVDAWKRHVDSMPK